MKAPKPKKLVLDTALLEEEFFEDVSIFGIVSALDFHQFVWTINQYMAMDFKRNHELEIEIQKVYFPIYTATNETALLEHYIYCNRNRTNFLLPEAKNIDYIWLIRTTNNRKAITAQIGQYLSKIKTIEYSFEIQSTHIKNKQHLII